MRTLIVSDLHLGSLSRSDLLRRVELRASLLKAAAEVERVVLLGDVLELRHGPMRDAMAAARPFFEELGSVLDGREVVVATGNHDHALVEPWLARRGEEYPPPPLEVEQLLTPATASSALERIARWVSPARLVVAFPGLWVRPDVYATHGHYLDCHLTVPTLERLSVAVMSLLLRRPSNELDSVDAYESLGAPVFAWRDVAARDVRTGRALNGIAAVNAWRELGGSPGSGRLSDNTVGGAHHPKLTIAAESVRSELRTRALVGGFRLAVAALNRAGLGPMRTDISVTELRRAALLAMGEVAARLELGDAYVVFGHTHRAGPIPGDNQSEWQGRAGARLVNAGSWTYSGTFLTDRPGESPYWPGTCVLVEDAGPPQVLCLLADRMHAEIEPVRV